MIPKDTISIERTAAHVNNVGITAYGMKAAAKILGLHLSGDWLHLPRSLETVFFEEARLASQMIEAQKKRLNREK